MAIRVAVYGIYGPVLDSLSDAVLQIFCDDHEEYPGCIFTTVIITFSTVIPMTVVYL